MVLVAGAIVLCTSVRASPGWHVTAGSEAVVSTGWIECTGGPGAARGGPGRGALNAIGWV